MTPSQARALGYVQGAKIEILGDLRVMKSGRITEINGNLLALGSHPFWIYFRGHWIGMVLKR